MLDLQLIRDKPEEVRANLSRRGLDISLDPLLELDARRRSLLAEVESLRAERNRVSKEIGRMKEASERQPRIEAMRQLGLKVEALDAQVNGVDQELRAGLLQIPNLVEASVPDGTDDTADVVLRTVGERRAFGFKPQPHWDLAPALGILDFERGVKITGSRFYVLSGAGARLQRALIAWMIDLHLRQGYLEKYTPFVVREQTLLAAGQLPKFRDNLYHDVEDDLWMVPTAEVPLTGLHMDEILEGESLPRRYVAYTACFRREKMSAGRDVRGIKRGHQFDKVEMYIFCRPEDSEAEHERMIAHAEATCTELGLAHRVKSLCAGEVGFAARKTYDVEAWAPGCEEWLEVSSVSNCGDFQARRANARFRRGPGAHAAPMHTLNGSGLALPRTLIAVLENYQQADGTVVVPDVLRPWMGGQEVIAPENLR